MGHIKVAGSKYNVVIPLIFNQYCLQWHCTKDQQEQLHDPYAANLMQLVFKAKDCRADNKNTAKIYSFKIN